MVASHGVRLEVATDTVDLVGAYVGLPHGTSTFFTGTLTFFPGPSTLFSFNIF